MKSILFLLLATYSSQNFAQSFNSGKPTEWIDLIGKKYSSKDQDLIGFKITPPEVSCDSLLQKCAVIWNNSSERKTPNCKAKCNDERLQEYEIFFEVIDRKGNKITIKNIKWNLDVISKKAGYVQANKRFIELGKISLDYTTINYWVQNIKWKKIEKRIVEEEPDRKAFTLQDIIKSSKEQTAKEALEAQQEETQ